MLSLYGSVFSPQQLMGQTTGCEARGRRAQPAAAESGRVILNLWQFCRASDLIKERQAARPVAAERQAAGAESGRIGSKSVAVLSRRRLHQGTTGREARGRRAASSRSRKRSDRF